MEVGDQGQAGLACDGLLAPCNTGHPAVNCPYIHVVCRADHQYLQDFAPTP